VAWTDPPSYTNGQIITQTDLHVGLRDNMRELWHEIAYVEFTSNVVVSGVAEATPTDIVSSGAVTYTAAPIILEFWCYSATHSVNISLWDGATQVTRWRFMEVSVDSSVPYHLVRRLTPTAASHTYKARAWSTGTIYAGAGGVGVNPPGFMRVLQRGG
jgi:hypothetical protein